LKENLLGKLDFLMERRKQEVALGYRGFGKKRLADALTKIEHAVENITDPVVHGDGEVSPGLLSMLNDVLSVERYDDAIPKDGAAMEMFENIALAIEMAFELGKYAPGGKLDATALATLGGRARGTQREEEADIKWRNAAKKIWFETRGNLAAGDPRRKSQGDVEAIIRIEVLGAPGSDHVIRTIRGWDNAAKNS
jgi:hypothetical protein